jgi:hypothetical protein
MTGIKRHLATVELQHRCGTASEPITRSRRQALWLLLRGHGIDQVANPLTFSACWARVRIERCIEGGPDRLADQRANNGTEPTILTPQAICALKARPRSPPDDGGQWKGPEVARSVRAPRG